MTPLSDIRVALLAINGFEQSKLTEPKAALEAAGATVLVVSPESGSIRGWDQGDWSESVDVYVTIGDAASGDYHALVLPGGQITPDVPRIDNDPRSFI